jgi:gamma-glutamyltranspeptidase/glutathione hydrolase
MVDSFVLPKLEFSSRRSPVMGRKGLVASSQPLATAAGIQILDQGGSAADAAVAVAAAINVTEPMSTGLGGDCFVLYYDAKKREVTALNGSGRCPAALTLQRMKKENIPDPLPIHHPYSVTVPGACAGWCDLIERYGKLPLKTTFEPAIRLADEGFPVSALTSFYWQGGVERTLTNDWGGRELTLHGRAPRAGEVFRNPGLAHTLMLIAENGKKAYYQGEIAAAIAAAVQKAGGCMTEEDLAAHESTWVTPISSVYKGVRLWECPPNGQGLVALLALNIMKQFDISSTVLLSVERLHLEIEALRLAFADAQAYICDPAVHKIPVGDMLSDEYAASRAKLINLKQATIDQRKGLPRVGDDTVYFCTVDSEGNACSFINSLYMGFGSGIVPEGYGFALQNRGLNFSLDPSHPNALAPGKRPYHTIIPAMATIERDKTLFGPLGVMGGFMQPQGHLQVFLSMIEDRMDPQTALDTPRFCLVEGNPAGNVALEDGIPVFTMAALADMGHTISSITGYQRAMFGRGQIICKLPGSPVFWAGSDPRADGCAAAQV